MNPHDKNLNRTHSSMPDEMDRLLVAHFGEELAPSSGFAHSVMETVQAEAAVPPPLPFPWRRVVPGLIAMLCGMIGFGVFALRELRAIFVAGTGQERGLTASLQTASPLHLTTLEQALCWIAMAACLSVAVTVGSMRLAGGR